MTSCRFWWSVGLVVVVCVACGPQKKQIPRNTVTSPGGESHPAIDQSARPLERKVRFTSESESFAAVANGTVIPAPSATNPRLVLFYTVGSDLEDGTYGGQRGKDNGYFSHVGESSNDMRELIRGYALLTADERAKVRVLIAFGGALKVGWRGVKYADIDCLIKDGGPGEMPTGEFGDDNCYLGNWPDRSMGDPQTLRDFLVFAKTRYPSVSSVSLVMGDHGAALSGFGHTLDLLPVNDPKRSQAQQQWEESKLSVRQIADAISQSGINLGLLGFDACLMGNLETAYILRNSARLLVASAEVEPGHGWSYHNFMRHFVESDSLAVFARKVIDDYAWLGDSVMSDEATGVLRKTSHFLNNDKTLALIDLKNIGGLYHEWASFVTRARGSMSSRDLFASFASAKQYYYNVVDMSSFASEAEWLATDKRSLGTDAFRAAVDLAVIYVASDNAIGPGVAISAINPMRLGDYQPSDSEFANNSDLPAEWRDLAVQTKTDWALYKLANPAPRLARRSKSCQPNLKLFGGEKPYTCFDFPVIRAWNGLVQFGAGFGITGETEPLGRLELTDDKDAFALGGNGKSWLALCDGPCAASSNFIYLPFEVGVEPGSGNSNFSINGVQLLMNLELQDRKAILAISFEYPEDSSLYGKRPDVTFRKGDSVSARGKTIVLQTEGYVGFRPLPVATALTVYPVAKYAFEPSWRNLPERESLLTSLAFAGTAGRSRTATGCNKATGANCVQECAAPSWSHMTVPPVNDCVVGAGGCLGTRQLCLTGQDQPSDGILTGILPQNGPCAEGYRELLSFEAPLGPAANQQRRIRFCGSKSRVSDLSGKQVVTGISFPGAGGQLNTPVACPAGESPIGTIPDCFKPGEKFCKGVVNFCVKLSSLGL